MELLVPFALKSLLIAGLTLGLLRLMLSRSAAERSMVAHLGLLALLIVPLGSVFLPGLGLPAASAAAAVRAPARAAVRAAPPRRAAPAPPRHPGPHRGRGRAGGCTCSNGDSGCVGR